jgi:hypothetical protein
MDANQDDDVIDGQPRPVAPTRPAVSWREAAAQLPLGRLLPVIRMAYAAQPQRADVRKDFAKALFATDRMAELVAELGPTVAVTDADPELLYYVGRAALATGDCGLATDALRSAAEQGFAVAFTYLAEALLRLHRASEAIEAGLTGLARSAGDYKSLAVVARALLQQNAVDRLWHVCRELRERGAWGGYFPAIWACAAAARGDEDAVAELIDPSRWFAQAELATPDGFNQALAAELLAHKSLGAVPSTRATRGTAAWIDRLETNPGPTARDLLARIRAEVETYVAERLNFADHPIMAQRPEIVELTAWAVEVHGDGHQAAHIHPSGWISGVYYVDVPKGASGSAGAIEFGLLPLDGEGMEPPRWHVIPRPGMLLLFPSYYAHRTRSTGVADRRVSIAFDIIPSASGS